jgi:potassium-transporting ATPase KdpC subunit
MYQEIRSSLGLIIFSIFFLGVGYPLFISEAGGLLFPHQANGSFVKKGDTIIGSELIGQNFSSDKYFHSRPSAAGNGYDAGKSSGSNLAPTSKKLIDEISSRIAEIRKTNDTRPIPVDLVTSSGSGLDPDISVASAKFQAGRIAEIRSIPLSEVEKLISSYTISRTFGILGERRINVLAINQALDQLSPVSEISPPVP